MLHSPKIQTIKDSLLPLSDPDRKHDTLKSAAVLMPLVFSQSNQLEVILTRRAEHLKHHPGQISFPGGGYEIQDESLSITATRETYEEIGIRQEQISLLGRLPLQETVSKYQVSPFVGLVDPGYQLSIDENEVAEVFTVPLDFLTDQTNQKRVSETFNQRQYSYYVIQYKHYNIWGATARILVNFSRRQVNPTSVAR